MSDSWPPCGLQHTRLPSPSPSPGVCSNSYSLSCEAIQQSNSLLLPSPPAFNLSQQQSFPTRLLFASGSQSIGASASASVFPVNIQDWFPSGWTGWTSLQSKGLSRVFSSIKILKHQFFWTQTLLYCPSLTSTHDYWKNQSITYIDLCQQSDTSAF